MQVAAAVGIPIEPASLGVRLLFAHDLASTSARLPTKPLHGKAAQPMVSRGRGLPAGALLAPCISSGRELAGETAGGRGAEGRRDFGGPRVLGGTLGRGRPRCDSVAWSCRGEACGIGGVRVGDRERCVERMHIRGAALAPSASLGRFPCGVCDGASV